MSKATTPGVEAEDHTEQADWVAISKAHGSDRRLHRVQGDPGPGELNNGDPCETACETTLTSDRSYWRAKPAGVFPPGYHPLCQDPECFGEAEAGDQ